MLIAALGVVFGDIGTSPLYAFKETLNPEHGVVFAPAAVLGLLSLIFWGLMLVVTLKYVVFVLRADHDGEGGILALQALARNAVTGPATPLGLNTPSSIRCSSWQINMIRSDVPRIDPILPLNLKPKRCALSGTWAGMV